MGYLYKMCLCSLLVLLSLVIADYLVSAELNCDAACAVGDYNPQCPCFRHLFRWGKRSGNDDIRRLIIQFILLY